MLAPLAGDRFAGATALEGARLLCGRRYARARYAPQGGCIVGLETRLSLSSPHSPYYNHLECLHIILINSTIPPPPPTEYH